jgi:hypothetical protein
VSDGVLALSGFQGGIESTRGTLVAATRKQPMNGWFVSQPRGAPRSPSSGCRSSTPTARSRSSSSPSSAASRSTRPSRTCRGSSRASPRAASRASVADTAAYTYTSPRRHVDDLKTVSWEAVSDTQDFAFPGCLGEKFDLSFTAGGPCRADPRLPRPAGDPAGPDRLALDRVTEDILGDRRPGLHRHDDDRHDAGRRRRQLPVHPPEQLGPAVHLQRPALPDEVLPEGPPRELLDQRPVRHDDRVHRVHGRDRAQGPAADAGHEHRGHGRPDQEERHDRRLRPVGDLPDQRRQRRLHREGDARQPLQRGRGRDWRIVVVNGLATLP